MVISLWEILYAYSVERQTNAGVCTMPFGNMVSVWDGKSMARRR